MGSSNLCKVNLPCSRTAGRDCCAEARTVSSAKKAITMTENFDRFMESSKERDDCTGFGTSQPGVAHARRPTHAGSHESPETPALVRGCPADSPCLGLGVMIVCARF